MFPIDLDSIYGGAKAISSLPHSEAELLFSNALFLSSDIIPEFHSSFPVLSLGSTWTGTILRLCEQRPREKHMPQIARYDGCSLEGIINSCLRSPYNQKVEIK